MFRVEPIACLKDNYAYLVVCEATREAAIVDPSEAPPVIAAVERAGVKLVAISGARITTSITSAATKRSPLGSA